MREQDRKDLEMRKLRVQVLAQRTALQLIARSNKIDLESGIEDVIDATGKIGLPDDVEQLFASCLRDTLDPIDFMRLTPELLDATVK